MKKAAKRSLQNELDNIRDNAIYLMYRAEDYQSDETDEEKMSEYDEIRAFAKELIKKIDKMSNNLKMISVQA